MPRQGLDTRRAPVQPCEDRPLKTHTGILPGIASTSGILLALTVTARRSSPPWLKRAITAGRLARACSGHSPEGSAESLGLLTTRLESVRADSRDDDHDGEADEEEHSIQQ
jgi:hypothetical protein